MTAEEIENLIRAGLPGAEVRVRTEDNVHYAAAVIAAAFAGLRPLQRHQLVYRTLGELMGGEIHALALETLTPDEFAARSR